MSRVYDSWEKLVEAVLDREELRRLAYCPSLSSTTSSAGSSSRFSFQDAFVDTADPEGIPASVESSSNPDQVNATFTFSELAAATRNFHGDCVIDEGGFGKLYKGFLKGSNRAVTVKQFGRDERNKEFLVECLMLSLLHHPNLINLIGHCADGNQRLLVYEYFPLGSLEKHLHEPIPGRKHLDWNTRMKIAAGVAKGLEYLHYKANPPVILRNLKPANIFLGEDFIPKISYFGFAKLGHVGDKTHIMGTVGYCDPEYALTGQLSVKADVFSFGVILLEIISGRKAIHALESRETQNIVAWARPLFRDRRNFPQLVDPALQGEYPLRPLYQAIAVAAMCVKERGDSRPTMVDVTTAMTYLSSQPFVPQQNSYSAIQLFSYFN